MGSSWRKVNITPNPFRKIKREEFKKELASLIYDKIKDIIPNRYA
jgi:hypothetical protein